MSRDRLIGTEKGLPWDIPEEYNLYLSRISGQTVIMGRRTFELFGDDLTSKYTIVVSSDFPPGENYKVCTTVDEAIRLAENYGLDVYIAGGGTIYKQTLEKADLMYLTYIDGKYSGVAYFPEFDQNNWEITDTTRYPKYEIVTYRKKTETY
ncbi:MAG: dihydrofolate reductase [Bacteroidia bacterium]|nr:dihydrofolate reductase [Bacteroidia bacterium]